jgi:formate hydrogenlyase subunit 6/NADH:ubiquinone oxidoreductase subunit I
VPRLRNFADRFAQTWSLLELLRGLRVTGRYLFRRKFTVHYPEERTPQSPRFRRRLAFGDRKEVEIAADRAADARFR